MGDQSFGRRRDRAGSAEDGTKEAQKMVAEKPQGATRRRDELDRRAVLKGAAATAGLAAGSGALSGFPTIWAQNLKDVTLLQVGGSYSSIIHIARQPEAELGLKVENHNPGDDP